MSAQQHGSSVYRGASLEEVLPKIRAELGPDAIILCEREGVVGGIGGFFAKRCVEVEAAPGAPLAEPRAAVAERTPSVPARVASNAYAHGSTVSELSASLPEPAPAQKRLRELTFADLLAQAGPPAEDLPQVPEAFMPLMTAPTSLATRIDLTDEDAGTEDWNARDWHGAELDGTEFDDTELDDEPAANDEAAVRRSLHQSGFPEADTDEIVRHAMLHARPFAPHASLRDVVRASLAETLQTPLGWKSRRRVLVLAGTEGAGTSEVAAAICAGYARVGLSVGALGLDGVRAAVALATNTEDAAVSVAIAEDVDDVRRALERLGRPDLLVAIAPTIVPGDEAGLARTAELLAELPAHDLHLVLPSGATAAAAEAAYTALSGAVRVKGVLPVAFDEAATIGGVVSLALRNKLELRWTAAGAGTVSVVTAAPAELAAKALR